ncbi:subtilisin-like protein [Lactarius indigo]|nr:subtilisin-like protein [Lactarius indigo]
MRYYWLSVISILSAVPFADLATAPPPPSWGDVRVKHTWDTVPANWECLGPPPAGTTINLNIALKPDRDDALIEALYEVSNPEHERYRAHLSREQVAELVAPRQDTLELVHSWLQHHGVPSSSISTSHGGGWLKISGVPVSQADELLSASYQLYRHVEANETEVVLRTVGYALPAVLHAHVQMVAPTTYFDPPRKLLSTPLQRPSEEGAGVVGYATSRDLVRMLPRVDNFAITPAFLRWLYGTQGYMPVAMGYNVLGVLGLSNEYPSYADLTRFMIDFRADAVAATFTVEYINGGGFDPGHPGTEASLDIQYSEAMTYPTPNVFYSAGGLLRSTGTGEPAPDDPYLVWLNYLLAEEYIPPTISISWANPETFFPREYATTLCTLFARLGLRGASVLIASGDFGVGLGDCKDSSGNVRFVPMFPASCPWVTSVGGTRNYNPEVAMYMSGGGFSVYFPRPPYQDAVVPPFVESLGTAYAGFYNPVGRGIPDISAQSFQFLIYRGAGLQVVSGTSAATPTVAGIVSLLNDYLISTGRGRLGFLNFLLYGYGLHGLNDIISGSNPGCETDGFTAIPGWDPVTGLGTPNFQVLQYILDLLFPVQRIHET